LSRAEGRLRRFRVEEAKSSNRVAKGAELVLQALAVHARKEGFMEDGEIGRCLYKGESLASQDVEIKNSCEIKQREALERSCLGEN
jgi:hypothetical protein